MINGNDYVDNTKIKKYLLRKEKKIDLVRIAININEFDK